MAVELEVSGRHAMLFDDDATLEFVNSKDALIEWNSLFIDRFDVRNLITGPPPPSFRTLPTSYYRVGFCDLVPDDDSDLYPDLHSERFGDLDSGVDDVDDGKFAFLPHVDLSISEVKYLKWNRRMLEDITVYHSRMETLLMQPTKRILTRV